MFPLAFLLGLYSHLIHPVIHPVEVHSSREWAVAAPAVEAGLSVTEPVATRPGSSSGLAATLLESVAGANVSVTATPQSSSELLELEESFAISLPDSFQITGAAISPSGLLALWSWNSAYLIVARPPPGAAEGEMRTIGQLHLSRPIGAAFLGSDSLLEVVDAAGPSVLGFSFDGALLYERSLEVPAEPEVAAHDGFAWFLGVPDSGQYRIFRVDGKGGRTLQVYSIERNEEDPWYLPIFQLSAGNGEIFAAMTESPFEVCRLSPDGQLLGTMRPGGEDELSDDRGGSRRLLVALPVLRLANHLLQTQADLSSDLRIVTIYDSAGHVVRRRTVNAPMGFVASLPDRRILLAVRWTGKLELVGYAWRWSDAKTTGREK
ncbi:MAG: hypothetical protein PVG79_12490 [Gemmatimonadales bacterium]|jgi:hypothetical protein